MIIAKNSSSAGTTPGRWAVCTAKVRAPVQMPKTGCHFEHRRVLHPLYLDAQVIETALNMCCGGHSALVTQFQEAGKGPARCYLLK